MKDIIQGLLRTSLKALAREGVLPDVDALDVVVERTKDNQHGDFASNVALKGAKLARSAPRQLAERIVAHLPTHELLDKIEIAGPGFINFYMKSDATQAIIERILTQKEAFGCSEFGAGQKVLIEFVSANPTGPLHVGHGRGAAFGASLGSVLKAAGYEVSLEYYVNDAGRQMDILATSIWLRYLEAFGIERAFPVNGYRGQYVIEMAIALKRADGDRWVHAAESVYQGVPPDEAAEGEGDKEAHIDGLIANAKALLLPEGYERFHQWGLTHILDDIKDDLTGFQVHFDNWFSEHSMHQGGTIAKAIETLNERGFIYERDGALWFRSTRFDDDKDRVVQREDGRYTYFAADIAYHFNKFQRGFEQVIDIFGADHHGFVPRLRACVEAMGNDVERLHVFLVQFAILYRGKERVQMSTRSGEFVTLRQLREEVGDDAARFFYVMRKREQHLDFDLELAKSRSNENPVYYVQYAHARVCSLLSKLSEQGYDFSIDDALPHCEHLTEPQERALMQSLAQYPEIIVNAAKHYEPHTLAHYLKDLAGDFHAYYNAHRMLIEDETLRNARIALSLAVRQVLANGLTLLGVNAPDSM